MNQKTIQKSRIFDENGNFFCEHEDCQKVTTYSDRGFNHHLKHAHGLSVEQYYRKYLMEEGENLCESSTCRKDKKFTGIRQPFKRFCSGKCAQNDKGTRSKVIETIKEKYGSHKAYTSHVKEKSKETYREKYGVDHYFQSDEFKSKNDYSGVFHKSNDKRIATNLTKYGTANVFASDKIKDKIKQTNLENYGVENWKQSKEAEIFYSEQTIKTAQAMIDKNPTYDGYVVTKYLNDRRYELSCPCGHVIDIAYALIQGRVKHATEICTECSPITKSSSGQEKKLLEYIRSIYDGEIIENDRETLDGKEIDIFLPELKIGFEFSGLYWHSEIFKTRNYHLEKTVACELKGVHLVHIWEDHWQDKREIVYSHIKNVLRKPQIFIDVGECEIREIDTDQVKPFLNINHIQGWCVSEVNLGLYHNNQLVSVMIFGGQGVFVPGPKLNENEWDMLRFCNAIGYNVPGAVSKLFSYFTEKYEPVSVRSYCDRSWSKGNIYHHLGFNLIDETEPTAFYIIDGSRYNESKFEKKDLVEMGFDPEKTVEDIMLERGNFRIYNCGYLLFEWKAVE